jgi:hypothetical protein
MPSTRGITVAAAVGAALLSAAVYGGVRFN